MRMKHRRLILATSAVLIFLGAFVFSPRGHGQAARQKLDNMLGPTKELFPTPLNRSMPEPLAEGGTHLDLGPFGLLQHLMPKSVDVQENADAYILRIPVASADDADQVLLSVMPDRIEVSGMTGSRKAGATMNSSFMQSFTTSQPVLPNQVTRQIQKDGSQSVLVVTIPKQQHGLFKQQASPMPKDNNAKPSHALPEFSQLYVTPDKAWSKLDDHPGRVF